MTNYFTHCLLLHLWIWKLQVILTGDVELNLGTKPSSGHKLFLRITFLMVYKSLRKLNIICLSETYLGSSIISQDRNLEMQWYTSIPPPFEFSKYKLLQECIAFVLSIKNKLRIIAAIYRSPCQSPCEFTSFNISLELTLQAVTSKNLSFKSCFRCL